jgi:NAD(P)-dependent dehydrogenase (short-subunit alcohol dehydrogenase family)
MKKVIISGTSRGIGFETAKILADQGHQILALSRNINPVLKKYTNIISLAVDLTLTADLQTVEDYISAHWQHVDVLIHNAGALVNKPFEELTGSLRLHN